MRLYLGHLFNYVLMAALHNAQLWLVIKHFALYNRYIDCIVCVADVADIAYILPMFNIARRNIHFTLGREASDRMGYLDA